MNTEQERADLLPCPFCGAGTTEIQENGRPWLGTRWGEPVSVSVRHWCDHVDGQPSRMIERVGRDRAAAIAAWNRRAALQSQDRADAERYRTLVASGKFVPATLSPSCLWGLRTSGTRATKAELDAAIDRARRAEGDGE